MQKILLLSLAGALGTLARYGLSLAVANVTGKGLPWGTALANLTGCLLFGLAWVLADERGLISPELRGIVLAGFLGAFTTFSSLIFESGELFRGGLAGQAALNLLGQNVLGFAAFYAGAGLGRLGQGA